ncbi:MAG: NAD(P)H-hydrate dehydratase [Piscirickettsiaceae bacterium]|nr:MAG: NAD(P)H-hydrate dehydratase [Piscirickettsiaceae bacterium]
MVSVQQQDVDILSFEKMQKMLLPRDKFSHKGDFGHVLLVGGNLGYMGAVCLAAEASLRVGSGLVSVATRAEHASLVTLNRLELMCRGVSNQIELKRLSERCNVIGVGPGLGESDWSHRMFEGVLGLKKATVVDADGLNLLAKEARKNDCWVLTPHPAEAARLLDCSTADIQANRVASIKQLQQQYGGVIVLKGAGTLIHAGNNVFICQAGNPGMASGGMGDVLTGIITGLIAQGLGLLESVKLAVLIHATAGDRAALAGERGLLASDLMPHIRELVNEN